ncbi:MAG TPA: SdrD B-like domain-containing protein, partial [Pyrinomonadaceae bacterium]|nr:SdrD B-like domain-containing protein [Pyrinomonadaceae bacterium]
MLSESASTRAIALDSVTFLRGPFPIRAPFGPGADGLTRIIVFSMNLNLKAGEDLSTVTAEAEDQGRRTHPLGVEYVGPVPGQTWMSAVVLKLNENLGNAGDVLIRVSYRGTSSNRVRVGVGHVGGGPPDDAGARPTPVPAYTIGGRVTNGAAGVGGVTLTLTDGENKLPPVTAATDADGNYSFGNLPRGLNYSVTPSRTNYTFNPAAQIIQDATGNSAINFAATPVSYVISGGVTGAKGALDGVKVLLSGTQSASTYTDVNGRYAFTVQAEGSYQVRPDDGYFYSYTPAGGEINNLSGNQVVNFAAAPVPVTGETNVLEFDGSPKTVDYGYFWHMNVPYGHFFWEFWAMPSFNAGATYLISDGYGGAHSILFGFNSGGAEPGRYSLFGNTFDGQTVIFFNSDAGPAPNEWGHFAVGWDGAHVITYFNGVPVGKRAFAGPRFTPGYFGGGGKVLIGGSDHNNFVGRIAQVRGYEGWNPRGDAGGAEKNAAQAAFAPDTIFRSGGNLLSRFFQPKDVADNFSPGYSPGWDGPGKLRGTINGTLNECPNCPLPQYVNDSTAP